MSEATGTQIRLGFWNSEGSHRRRYIDVVENLDCV